MRIVAEDAVFGVFCRRWGVPLMDGGTVRLPRLIGLSNAMDMILTGRAVNAKEARRMGLANRVVPKGQALIEATKVAFLISQFPQNTMRSDRMSALKAHDLPFKKAMQSEFEYGISVVQEGVIGAKDFISGKGRGGDFGFLEKPKL